MINRTIYPIYVIDLKLLKIRKDRLFMQVGTSTLVRENQLKVLMRGWTARVGSAKQVGVYLETLLHRHTWGK